MDRAQVVNGIQTSHFCPNPDCGMQCSCPDAVVRTDFARDSIDGEDRAEGCTHDCIAEREDAAARADAAWDCMREQGLI